MIAELSQPHQLDVFFTVLQSATNTATLSSVLSSLLALVEDSWGTPRFFDSQTPPSSTRSTVLASWTSSRISSTPLPTP